MNLIQHDSFFFFEEAKFFKPRDKFFRSRDKKKPSDTRHMSYVLQ